MILLRKPGGFLPVGAQKCEKEKSNHGKLVSGPGRVKMASYGWDNQDTYMKI
jgi:hypothetical protein